MSTVSPTVVDRGNRQVSRSIVVDASAHELFEIVVHPHRHHEIDGSGMVGLVTTGDDRMVEGRTFTVNMKAMGIPYRITSTVTGIAPDRIVEWRHPSGHRWRYEFEPISPGQTRVTETWDYRDTRWVRAHELMGFPKRNAKGIEQTLIRLAEGYAP